MLEISKEEDYIVDYQKEVAVSISYLVVKLIEFVEFWKFLFK